MRIYCVILKGLVLPHCFLLAFQELVDALVLLFCHILQEVERFTRSVALGSLFFRLFVLHLFHCLLDGVIEVILIYGGVGDVDSLTRFASLMRFTAII